MRCTWPSVAWALALIPGVAVATEVSFELIGPGYASDISADGTVVVGNTQGEYETFRWTEETGVVPLGRPTTSVLGGGAGSPDVSADGLQVSATILGADSSLITPRIRLIDLILDKKFPFPE